MSKSQNLISNNCPNIYSILQDGHFNWVKFDNDFESNFLKVNVTYPSNFLGIVLHAETGNKSLSVFIKYIDDLVAFCEKYVNEKKKFRDILYGKITNFNDYNFLSPIGELSVLKKLIDAKYKLLGIEDNSIFPNAKPKDFLFDSPRGQKLLVEIINIKLKDNYNDLSELEKHLLSKVKNKISEETKGINDTENSDILYFQPVLWHVDLDKTEKYYHFFKDFSHSFGQNFIRSSYKVLGFCSYGKRGDNYIFGELSTIYDLDN
jgi:hypothetical protein